jgi:hypothetical protein
MTSTTATPRTATSTRVAAPTALGSLDIGTRATTSPELLTSILYSPSFCDVTPSMKFPLPLRGDVSALVYFNFLSSLTVRDAPVVHDATAMTTGDVRVYVVYKDRLGFMSCLVLQVGPLYSYIYSPKRLNNKFNTLRQFSLPQSFYNNPTFGAVARRSQASQIGRTRLDMGGDSVSVSARAREPPAR